MEGDMKNEGWLGNLPIKKKKERRKKYGAHGLEKKFLWTVVTWEREERKNITLGHTFLSQPYIQFLLSIPISIHWAHWA